MPTTLYSPKKYHKPSNILDVPSAWRGLEGIILDITEQFGLKRERALEFGVEFGYSTIVLSNYFDHVDGVDTFRGDQHTEDKDIDGLYEALLPLMPANVTLHQMLYQDFIKQDIRYDLIHVDIVHTYEDTYACGDWAIQHSDCVIFHDTESFKDVKRAVRDLAIKHNRVFYNYPFHHGLGILCKTSLS